MPVAAYQALEASGARRERALGAADLVGRENDQRSSPKRDDSVQIFINLSNSEMYSIINPREYPFSQWGIL